MKRFFAIWFALTISWCVAWADSSRVSAIYRIDVRDFFVVLNRYQERMQGDVDLMILVERPEGEVGRLSWVYSITRANQGRRLTRRESPHDPEAPALTVILEKKSTDAALRVIESVLTKNVLPQSSA